MNLRTYCHQATHSSPLRISRPHASWSVYDGPETRVAPCNPLEMGAALRCRQANSGRRTGRERRGRSVEMGEPVWFLISVFSPESCHLARLVSRIPYIGSCMCRLIVTRGSELRNKCWSDPLDARMSSLAAPCSCWFYTPSPYRHLLE